MVNYYVRCKATSSGLEVKSKQPKNKAFVEEVTIKTSDGGIHHMLAHNIPGKGEELKVVITYTGQDRAKLRAKILKVLS